MRLPLEWPETWPAEVPAAMRVASHAAERGRGAAFVLAAGRLAFCGGFDLDDPEILVEAAAAAGLGLDDCLQAAGDRGRDGAIEAAGRRLLAAGADRLPALRIGRALYWGEEQVADAAAAARLHAAAARVARRRLVRRDETGEDLLVELLARLLPRSGAGATRNGSSRSDSGEEQLEVGVADLGLVLHGLTLAPRVRRLTGDRRPTPRPGGRLPRHDR